MHAAADWHVACVLERPARHLTRISGLAAAEQQDEIGRSRIGTDRAERHQVFARLLQIVEREDPAYTVLHQNAVFTGKPISIRWTLAPSFAMDLRAGNWGQSPA